MAFSGKPFFQIPRPIRAKGFVESETLAGNKTLVQKDSFYQFLDPDGTSRDVTLPAELDGIAYNIRNIGTALATLVIKNDAGTAIKTLFPNEQVLVVCDGTNWLPVDHVATTSINVETLAGNKTLTTADALYQFLDTNGSNRTITLPAEEAGLRFKFKSTGAESLLVEDDAAGSIVTVTTGTISEVVCDGTTWQVFE